jgi:predicted transcriptional regulator
MGAVFDSKWDLRLRSKRDELYAQVLKVLTKKTGKTTRQIAEACECNHEQARRMLNALWDDGRAVPQGEKQQRVWFRT